MSNPFIGEVRTFSFSFPPKGWALCNGQLLAINSNQALFSLLGTSYGGDGIQTFALPNLQGRVPIGIGMAQGVTYNLGSAGGTPTVTLLAAQVPAHVHNANGSTAGPTLGGPSASSLPATYTSAAYNSGAGTTLAAGTVGPGGSGQPHTNLQPFIVVSLCIALVGIFPSRT